QVMESPLWKAYLLDDLLETMLYCRMRQWIPCFIGEYQTQRVIPDRPGEQLPLCLLPLYRCKYIHDRLRRLDGAALAVLCIAQRSLFPCRALPKQLLAYLDRTRLEVHIAPLQAQQFRQTRARKQRDKEHR